MARLILSTAEGQQAIELRPINSLGRHPNNSIQLLDKIVSKEHCIVEQRDGQFILRDLGSLNGTYINGERVRGEQMLRHGDEIALGSTRARYDDGSSPLNFAPPAIGPGAITTQQNAPNHPMPWQQQGPGGPGAMGPGGSPHSAAMPPASAMPATSAAPQARGGPAYPYAPAQQAPPQPHAPGLGGGL